MSELDPAFVRDAINLRIALGLGAVIGFERQWRQRMAGLRTNTLVSLGAATFVVFAGQFTGDSPTRVAAQVVTGIGFLGAGVISKEGANTSGLNTAATLLVLGRRRAAGRRRLLDARCVGRRPDHPHQRRAAPAGQADQSPADRERRSRHRLCRAVICRAPDEASIRALLAQGFSNSDIHLRELESADIEGSDRVQVTATLTSERLREIAIECIVGRLSLESGVTAARWKKVVMPI